MKIKGIGVGFGVISGITWALDSILIGLLLSKGLSVPNGNVVFLAPLVSTFLHDSLSTFWVAVYLVLRGNFFTAISKIRTKSGRFVILAALLGGPVGMTFYTLSIQYIGSSYAASFSAVYPAVGAFFAFLLLKDRLSIKNWIGLFISILFIFILGYSSGKFVSPNNILGFFFILICIFGWGMESVIIAYGMKDDEISPEESLQLRQLTSALSYGLIIIPVFKGYSIVSEVVINPEIFFILLIALAGSISYFFYYKAINIIGPTRAMALNISYSAWTIILGFLIVGTPLTFKLLFCSIMIILGSTLTVANTNKVSIKNLIKKKLA
ncbi:UNVERIFIED_ORG: drug/metabolite transporter (DMT)-like permease [Heyndrickxia coagulans]